MKPKPFLLILLAFYCASPASASPVEWQKIAESINKCVSHRYDGSDVSPEQIKACKQLLDRTFKEQRQELYQGLPAQPETIQASFISLIKENKDKGALSLLHKIFEQRHNQSDYLGAQIIHTTGALAGLTERPFIAAACRDTNKWTRQAVAEELGHFSTDHEALNRLAEMLGSEHDHTVRREIITSMGNFSNDPWAEFNLKQAQQEELATLKTIQQARAKLKQGSIH